MLRIAALAVFASAVLATLGYAFWASQSGDAAGLVNRRLTIPGIAMDSPQASFASSVNVSVYMSRLEPALTGSGTTTVIVEAEASGLMPPSNGAPVAASASLSVQTHPSDECVWNIEGGSGSLVLTYSRSTTSGIRLTFGIASDISWYYLVQCPGTPPPPPLRFPAAPVDESFGGWLGLLLPGTAGAGVTIDLRVDTNSSLGRCIEHIENTNEFGYVNITVSVKDAGCKLPTPIPPTPDPYAPAIP